MFPDKNCSDLDSFQLRGINLAMIISGSVGVLIVMTVLVAMIYDRVYKTVLQRLFIYTLFAVLFHEATHIANVEQRFVFGWQDQICALLGFISNWSSWTVYIFYLIMIFYLLLVVYSQIKGDQAFVKATRSKCLRILLEFSVILSAILFPLLILWVPYYQHDYGFYDGYCWISAAESNCTSVILMLQLIFGYSLYEAVGIVAMCISIVIIIFYCTLSIFLKCKVILKRILILLFTIIVHMIILNMMLVTRNLGYYFDIFIAVFATFDDLIFLAGYLVSFHSSRILGRVKTRVGKKKNAASCNFNQDREYGTFKETRTVHVPSSTFYEVEYTGEFTGV